MPRAEPLIDVAVAGGGPAGLAAALTLARAGMRVEVFERSAYDRWRPGESLSPEVKSSLVRLELNDRFKAIRSAERVCVLSSWNGPERVERPSILDLHGPGWHVERLEFDRLLVAAAEQRGIVVHRRSRLKAVERTSAGMRVTVRVGGVTRVVRARLLIDATGRRAVVARALGARWLAYDRLVGFIGRATAKRRSIRDSGDGRTLVVEAVPDGWWYAAPLADSAMVVAYMTDGDLFPSRARDRARLWAERLSETRWIREALEGHRRPRLLGGRLASAGRLQPSSGEGWLAVGEAALALDPLAGVGVARALASGIDAAEAWLASEKRDRSALARYRQRTARAFEAFMLQRRVVYGQNERWRDRLFWRRRQAPARPTGDLRLAPTDTVRLDPALAPAEATALIESQLPLSDARLLFDLCRTARPAHEIAAEFRARAAGTARDSDTVYALQDLVDAARIR